MEKKEKDFFKNLPSGYDLTLRKKAADLEWERIKRIRDGFAFQEEAEKVKEYNDEETLIVHFIPEFNSKLDELEIPEMFSEKYKYLMKRFVQVVSEIKAVRPEAKSKLKDTIAELNRQTE